MVRGVRAIGVPLPLTEASTGPKAAVELWPLVQAFAVQVFEDPIAAAVFDEHVGRFLKLVGIFDLEDLLCLDDSPTI